MNNLYQLQFLMTTPVISNGANTIEWQMDGYPERLKFSQKIISLIQKVIERQLSVSSIQTLFSFDTTTHVTEQNHEIQHVQCLNIRSTQEKQMLDLDLDVFTSITNQIEEALKALPDLIQEIIQTNQTNPEKVVLLKNNHSNFSGAISVSNELTMELAQKLRSIKGKHTFPVTIVFPCLSKLDIDINAIAKSSEYQSESEIELNGIISELSFKESRFSIKVGSKFEYVYTLSIDQSIKTTLMEHMASEALITVVACPRVQIIAGEERNKAYEFKSLKKTEELEF